MQNDFEYEKNKTKEKLMQKNKLIKYTLTSFN